MRFRTFCIGVDPLFFKQRSILLPIADRLEAFFFSDKHVLNLSMPPRMGKSYLLTLFTVWAFAQKFNGQTKVFRVCAENTLFQDFSKQTQYLTTKMSDIMEFEPINGTIDRWYIGNSTLPHFFGGGFGGNITGRGGNIAIFDDMYRNYPDAISAAYDRDLDFFLQSVVRGRMEGDNFKIINVGTRWTVNDWFAKFKPDVEVLLPALNDNGETCCEAYKSTRELLSIKDKLEPYIWDAQFMQRPTAQGRQRIFTQPFVVENEPINDIKPFIVIDPATDFGKDFFVCGLYKEVNGIVYLLDMFAEQSASIEQAAEWIKSKGDLVCFCESNGFGANVKRKLKVDFEIEVYGFTTNKDKYSRAWAVSNDIMKYLRITPECKHKELLQQQATDFPTAEHDDLIDNVVMCFEQKQRI